MNKKIIATGLVVTLTAVGGYFYINSNNSSEQNPNLSNTNTTFQITDVNTSIQNNIILANLNQEMQDIEFRNAFDAIFGIEMVDGVRVGSFFDGLNSNPSIVDAFNTADFTDIFYSADTANALAELADTFDIKVTDYASYVEDVFEGTMVSGDIDILADSIVNKGLVGSKVSVVVAKYFNLTVVADNQSNSAIGDYTTVVSRDTGYAILGLSMEGSLVDNVIGSVQDTASKYALLDLADSTISSMALTTSEAIHILVNSNIVEYTQMGDITANFVDGGSLLGLDNTVGTLFNTTNEDGKYVIASELYQTLSLAYGSNLIQEDSLLAFNEALTLDELFNLIVVAQQEVVKTADKESLSVDTAVEESLSVETPVVVEKVETPVVSTTTTTAKVETSTTTTTAKVETPVVEKVETPVVKEETPVVVETPVVESTTSSSSSSSSSVVNPDVLAMMDNVTTTGQSFIEGQQAIENSTNGSELVWGSN